MIIDLKITDGSPSFWGKILHVRGPIPTRGTDLHMTLTISDESIFQNGTNENNSNGIVISIFKSNPSEFPHFENVKNEINLTLFDLKESYSEPNIPISYGRVKLVSNKENEGSYSVVLTLSYTFDIIYDGNDVVKTFTSAPVPYVFSIENQNNKIVIKEFSNR